MVTIGSQTWMAENLNYEIDGSTCYNDSAKYCKKYGRLYTWAAAMDSAGIWTTNGKGCGKGVTCSPTYPVRGVCPEGWHLPDSTEWRALVNAVGGFPTAGLMLKSVTGWIEDDNNKDAYSFSALPGGYYLVFRRYIGDAYYRFANYDSESFRAGFWSSTEAVFDYYSMETDYVNYSLYMQFMGGEVNAGIPEGDKSSRFSVRCLKDAQAE